MSQPPSTQQRTSGHQRQVKAKSPVPVALIVQGIVAVLLAGLVVVIVMSKWPGDTASGQSTAASGQLPTTSPLGGDAGSAVGSSGSAASGQKVLKLADNPILQDPNAGLQNFVCTLPGWQSTPAGAAAFFTAATRCLNEAWGPFLEAYHMPFVPPTLHFPTGASFQTACGTISVGVSTAAYYCDNNLYVPFRGLQTEQYGDDPGVYLALIAHEYGHQAGQVSPIGLDLSRRKELQAQCFSGMFLGAVVDRGGSVTRDMYAKAWRDQDTRGDNTSGGDDHGTNAHYAQWWRIGAQSNRTAKCNTFAAPSSAVS